jgi:thymidylate kinase
MAWDKRHGNILNKTLSRFKEHNIKYFIVRNYEGLPNLNSSKDVDIIVEPESVGIAKHILKSVYKENGLSNYHEVQYGQVYCCHGFDINTKFGIHIDIIGSYVSKGFEIFTFDELYSYTENYNDFRVLNKYFEGVMVFIYKQFNYKPVLKEEYKEIIYNTYKNYPEFKTLTSKLVGIKLANNIFLEIEQKNFNQMLKYSSELTKSLRKFAFKKQPLKTIKLIMRFFWEKLNRLVFSYRKYSKVISVMAPDGAGKTTFLDSLIEKIEYYYVNDKSDHRCNVYHFRPNILPNLGELGEKAGIKEQDKDFTNPQRSKPANKLSSLLRITYYWLDYVIGFNLLVRKDVQYDKFSVFDRYSYDLMVDPTRTRLNLPMWLRKLFVKCMPHPKVVFYLDATPEVIYKRKQELTLDEIKRQTAAYKKVATSHNRFISLDADRPVSESVDDAIKIILEAFTVKL